MHPYMFMNIYIYTYEYMNIYIWEDNLRLEVSHSINLPEVLTTMKHFRKDVTISLRLYNFNDEQAMNEKFVELMGYYKLDEV